MPDIINAEGAGDDPLCACDHTASSHQYGPCPCGCPGYRPVKSEADGPDADPPETLDGSEGLKFDDTVDAWAAGYCRGREDASDAILRTGGEGGR